MVDGRKIIAALREARRLLSLFPSVWSPYKAVRAVSQVAVSRETLSEAIDPHDVSRETFVLINVNRIGRRQAAA